MKRTWAAVIALVAVFQGTAAAEPPADGVSGISPLGQVTLPDAAGGRLGDVAAHGSFAYVATRASAACERGGVHVVDLSDPTKPQAAGFVETPGAHVTEGVQVLDVATPQFTGRLLVVSREACGAGGKGGIALFDVTDPRAPKPLGEHGAASSHSSAGWADAGRVFVAMIDNRAERDVDIVEVTDPRTPAQVAEVGLIDFPQASQRPPTFGASPGGFAHDLTVERVDGRPVLVLSYWDAGHVVLDVSDPALPRYVGDTDFAATEPYAPQLGLPERFPPEGNAHRAAHSADGRFLLGVDEDLAPHRDDFEIASGGHAGRRFAAIQPPGVPRIAPDRSLAGATVFAGQACDELAPAPTGAVALVEGGGCPSQQKLDRAKAAGYPGVLMFVARDGCTAPPDLAVTGDIPFLFVGRSTGLRLLGAAFMDACDSETPPPGSPSANVRLERVFDGWGYVHLYDARTLQEIGSYAAPEALDRTRAGDPAGFSATDIATDPAGDRAYVATQAAGLRSVSFGPDGVREAGVYSEPGRVFGALEVHALVGGPVVLASDRESGLWVFRPAA